MPTHIRSGAACWRAARCLLAVVVAAPALRSQIQLSPGQVRALLAGNAAGAGASALCGTWIGTARDTLEDGQEVTYPIRAVITGSDDRLGLEVTGTAKVAVEPGRTLTLDVRVSYAGTSRAGDVRMTSQNVRVRVVEHDQLLPSPAQELVGRVEGDVLRGRSGSEADGWSTFEVRRERAGGGSARREPSSYATLVCDRQEIADPGMGGIASHTLLVPKGWSFSGGVRWTADPGNFVHFVGSLAGQSGESLHFDYNRRLTYSSLTDPQRGPIAPGTAMPDGSIFQPPPQQGGGAAIEVVVPRIHPRATGLRIADVQRMPDVEAKQRAFLAPVLKSIEESSQQLRQMGGPIQNDGRTWLVAERVRVHYQEDGRDWEEEVRYVILGFHSTVRSEWVNAQSGTWSLYDVRSVRAPRGQLDGVLPSLWSLAGSLQETPRWSAALAEIRRAISEARHRSNMESIQQIAERGRALARSRAELSDQQMRAWRDSQDSQHAIHKAHIQAITESQDFRAADGSTHTVTNHFERAFRDTGGSIILTNDPSYRPSADPAVNGKTWEEMQRVDPFGERR